VWPQRSDPRPFRTRAQTTYSSIEPICLRILAANA
jgi:hypothetical protein